MGYSTLNLKTTGLFKLLVIIQSLAQINDHSYNPILTYNGPFQVCSSYPAQACKQANIVARVSGGSWALLGWSFSGASPPKIEGHRLFKKVMHAWIKGSWKRKSLSVFETDPNCFHITDKLILD